MSCLDPDPLRTAAYASRTTLGGVLPERLQPLVEATAELSERFRAAGHTLYLVGGSVRDAIVADVDAPLLDGMRDLDFTTDARPDAIEAVVAGWADAVWTQGKRFGTIGCRVGDQKYEITTHRSKTTWLAGISPSTPWPCASRSWS
jgi:poly(A) polymerase